MATYCSPAVLTYVYMYSQLPRERVGCKPTHPSEVSVGIRRVVANAFATRQLHASQPCITGWQFHPEEYAESLRMSGYRIDYMYSKKIASDLTILEYIPWQA